MSYVGKGQAGDRQKLVSLNGVTPSYISETPSSIVTVDINGNADFTSIKSAVESLVGIASDTSPFVVQIAPGIYNEDPFVLSTGISIRGLPSTIITANNNSANFITVQSAIRIDIDSVLITGPTGLGAGIFHDSGQLVINNCGIRNSEIGVLSEYSAPILLISNCSFVSNTHPDKPYGTGVLIRGDSTGLDVRISNCAFGFKQTAIRINGGNNVVSSSFCRATDLGIHVTSGILSLQGFNASSPATGIYVTGGTLNGHGAKLSNSTSKDIVQVGQGNIFLTASDVETSQIQADDFTRITLLSQDDNTLGDFGTQIVGKLSVGVPELGSESTLGEGHSYTRGMLVYQSGVGGGTLIDVTSLVLNQDDGESLTFPGVAIDDSIYFASDLSNGMGKIRHHGIRTRLSGLATYENEKAFLVQLSTTTGWIDCEMMVVEASGKHRTARHQAFKSFNEEHIRYNINKVNEEWEKIDLIGDGTPRYWSRFILESGIVGAPTFDRLKLSSSSTQINEDGYLEYHGNARPFGTIQYDLGLLEPAASSPGNQDIYLSDNLDVGRVENLFQNNAVDRIGLCAFAPSDMDTSCPIEMTFAWFTSNNNSSDAQVTIRWSYVSAEEGIYPSQALAPTTSTREKSLTSNIPTPGVQNVLQTLKVRLDFEGLVTSRQYPEAGDLIFISIERDGPTDAHTGNITLVQMIPRYTRYTDGGHS